MKNIAKQLTVILLSVAVLSVIIAVVIVAIFFDPPCTWSPCEANYAYAFAIGLPLMQTVLALFCYLNLMKIIRNNCFYSALSFFLQPVLFLLWFLWELTGCGKDLSYFNFLNDILPVLIINVPFFILLVSGFLWFRKKMKNKTEKSENKKIA